jgi:hypothetical protein
MNRSIAAQEQIAQAIQAQRCQMARLIGTVSMNPHAIRTMIPQLVPVTAALRLAPRLPAGYDGRADARAGQVASGMVGPAR